jgi:histone deacetylase complex regulatory component SIN3
MRKIPLIVLIILIVSCKSASVTGVPAQTLETIVAENLGEDAVVQKNKDNSFALCFKENFSTLSVSYIIVRLNDLTIVEQDKTAQASFSWVDNYKVEIKTIAGMVKKEDQSTAVKVIDLTKYIIKL